MNTRILDLACIAVLCTILTLGLWPFHAPANDVKWLEGHNGLALGKFGTVISSCAFETSRSQRSEPSASLEIWLQPRLIWDSGTFLSFCTPEDPFRFSLRQSQTVLQLQAEIPNDRNRKREVDLYAEDVFRKGDPQDAFRKGAPRFISITAGTNGLAIYTDGVLVRRVPRFRLPPNQLTGRMVLGDSAGQSDSWRGRLLGVAVYDRELTPPQLWKHYQTWTQAGRPEIQENEGNLALYLFDEHAGNMVHDHGISGVDLSIPENYVVLNQIFLEPFWTEFNMSGSYWRAVLKNIVGFIPLGFCFCARLAMARHVKRPALTAVLLGALVSVTIEVLQAYLPTRDSGMTDIITNTLGTWVGAIWSRSEAAQASFAMLRHWHDARIGVAPRG